MSAPAAPVSIEHGAEPARDSEVVLRVLAAAAFIVFFQSYLLAPLIPSLATEFHASLHRVGLLVPAYMLPYGFSTLFYGPLSDRVGRRPVLLTMFGLLALCIAGMASARSIEQLLAWRIAAGLASGGIIPISLALLADLYPYERRGRPIGWIFGAIAGGSAFGSTLGALLNPIIGWRWTFLGVAVGGAVVFAIAMKYRHTLNGRTDARPMNAVAWVRGYVTLLISPRGWRAYSYILLNGMFQAGVFAWLGLYFSQRYGLGDRGIGFALLGYGVPGMLLGPTIGHFADRLGRRAIIPAGLAISAVAVASLAPAHAPLAWTVAAVTILSLGFDMSHPLLAGMVTSLDPLRVGQAMGLNAFVLFTGFGFGSMAFESLLTRGGSGGFALALCVFAGIEAVIALLAVPLFRGEGAVRGNGH